MRLFHCAVVFALVCEGFAFGYMIGVDKMDIGQILRTLAPDAAKIVEVVNQVACVMGNHDTKDAKEFELTCEEALAKIRVKVCRRCKCLVDSEA